MAALFIDRHHAGRVLGEMLTRYAHDPNVRVLALPRGGVPVGYEVARALGAPLDVFVVRKLGLPGHEEYAMGALSSGGVVVWNPAVIEAIALDQEVVESVLRKEAAEVQRREKLYRGHIGSVDARDRTLIVVDDGLATGSSMRAAVAALRRFEPQKLVVAVPTGALETCESIEPEVDELICAHTPEPFYAVGLWYQDFSQVTDEEVRQLLEQAAYDSAQPEGQA
jgi:predicted phosphoribosyltransferase